MTGDWNQPAQFALVSRDELQFKPAEDVNNDRLGVADLGIARLTAGLKAGNEGIDEEVGLCAGI